MTSPRSLQPERTAQGDIRSYSVYRAEVRRRLERVLSGTQLHPQQNQLLRKTLLQQLGDAGQQRTGEPLSLIYTTARAWCPALGEQAVHVGGACLLYIWALDLIDDVQDDDLAGSHYEVAGPAIAINCGLALFALSLRELRLAVTFEQRAEEKARWLELLNSAFLAAVVGQHADLMNQKEWLSSEQVLAMHQAKTSSAAFLMSCGALLGGCPQRWLANYSRFGNSLSQAVQIVDDLRDVYGKEHSPDLSTGKQTYPLATFREHAKPLVCEQLQSYLAQSPVPLLKVRQLLHDSGAVEHCAERLELLRTGMHAEIAATGNVCGFHRQLLSTVDDLVRQVYQPPPLVESAGLWQQQTGFHRQTRQDVERFSEILSALGAPPIPTLRPWSQPHYLYEPAAQTIHYPDLDDWGDDLVAFQASLLRRPDRKRAESLLREQSPLVMAHEMFHYWRDQCGKLSKNVWHEEYVANRLAIAYCRIHAPEVIPKVQAVAEEILEAARQAGHDVDSTILDTCHEPRDESLPSMLSMRDTAILHMQMLLQLVEEKPQLERDIRLYLDTSVPAPQAVLRKLITSVA